LTIALVHDIIVEESKRIRAKKKANLQWNVTLDYMVVASRVTARKFYCW